ncbi:MAG: 2-C-methyl-D-erythritol 2,4-cyclodiphosphate synthase, partial [Coraliomargarita sp.]
MDGFDFACAAVAQSAEFFVHGDGAVKFVDGGDQADHGLHALCDALLGAAGLGDIGRHFP